MIPNAKSKSLSLTDELRLLRERGLIELVNGVPVESAQYGALLLDFKNRDTVPWDIKRIWKMLYFEAGQVLTEDIIRELGFKSVSSVNLIFGRFAGRFYREFKKMFFSPPGSKRDRAGKMGATASLRKCSSNWNRKRTV